MRYSWTKSQQRGQGTTEYLVVTGALVFTFLAPITPPSVPDWRSDGVGTRPLTCPRDPYVAGSTPPARCTVVEILAEVMRKRNDGYTYAISSTYYPERLVSAPTDLFGDPEDPDTDSGTPGDPNSSAGDPGGTEPNFDVGSGTNQTVAVNASGDVIGKVNASDQCVKDDDGVIIGKVVVNEVWETDADCNVIYNDDSEPTVIGTVGTLESNGDIIDEEGNVIGKTDIG